MDCIEVKEGYKVRFTPLLPGDYYCSIECNKYAYCRFGSSLKIPCIGDKLSDEGAQETSSSPTHEPLESRQKRIRFQVHT